MIVNQDEKQRLNVEKQIDNKVFSGKVVSIAEAAAITKSPYKKLDFPGQRYHLTKYKYIKDDFIEIAEFSNVISNHVFQIFFPEHNIAVVEEASYKNALKLFPMPHEQQNNSISFEWNKPLVYIEEPVLMIGGHKNHFHWILNWLPRLFIAKEFQDMFGGLENIKICVDGGLRKAHIESLEKIGISQEQLLFNSMSYKNTEHFYYFKKLYFPNFFQPTEFSLFIRDYYHDFFTKKSLLKQDDSLPKLIYVSRQQERRIRRRVVNNEALEKCLKSYGFETVFVENLSFEEQINLFYNADLVLGPHGAGLANIVFCRPQTKLLVFEYSEHSLFEGLAKICELDPTVMVTEQHIDEAYEQENPKFQTRLRDFIVDIDRLESYLKDTLKMASDS